MRLIAIKPFDLIDIKLVFKAKQTLPIAKGTSFIVNISNRRLKFLYARFIFLCNVFDCLYEVFFALHKFAFLLQGNP